MTVEQAQDDVAPESLQTTSLGAFQAAAFAAVGA
jgi:hypothetical protein